MISYCQSFNSVYSTKTVTDKRILIDISIILEMIDRQEIFQIEWIEGGHQISDCLTKYGVSSSNLLRVIKGEQLF